MGNWHFSETWSQSLYTRTHTEQAYCTGVRYLLYLCMWFDLPLPQSSNIPMWYGWSPLLSIMVMLTMEGKSRTGRRNSKAQGWSIPLGVLGGEPARMTKGTTKKQRHAGLPIALPGVDWKPTLSHSPFFICLSDLLCLIGLFTSRI